MDHTRWGACALLAGTLVACPLPDFDTGDGGGDSALTGDSGTADTATPDDTAAPVLEDCSNGSDDDADGLVDCEDADCAGEPRCLEDCVNGLDDDGDGLTDCDDDDCWGVCTEVRVAVSGGGAATLLFSSDATHSRSWSSSRTERTERWEHVLDSVTGTLAVRTGSASSWTHCTWTATDVRFGATRTSTDGSWAGRDGWTRQTTPTLTRGSVTSSGGCALDPSRVLPSTLLPARTGGAHATWRATTAAGDTARSWYALSLGTPVSATTSATTVTPTYWSGARTSTTIHRSVTATGSVRGGASETFVLVGAP